MTNRTRAVWGGCFVLLGGAICGFPDRDWVRAASRSLIPGTEQESIDAARVGRALDDERERILQHNEIKRYLGAELVAGRISLAEAVEGFLAADEGCPKSLAVLRNMFPGRSDRERAARNVITWARCGGEPQPDLITRLEAEFRSLFPAD